MTFLELFKYIPHYLPPSLGSLSFNELCTYSHSVAPNDLFIAIKGHKTDGHQFIEDLLRKGAFVVANEGFSCQSLPPSLTQRIIMVPCTKEVVAPLAKSFFKDPDESLCMIGITGTNGKTTTSHIIYKGLSQIPARVGLIGTIHSIIDKTVLPCSNTTPDAFVLYQTLGEMKKAGCTHVVMEISSHALALKRTEYLSLDIALFTNITPEHLDFHKDMKDYLNTKLLIFDLLKKSKKQKVWALYNENSPVRNEIKQKLLSLNLPHDSFFVPHSPQQTPEPGSLATLTSFPILNIKKTSFSVYSQDTPAFTIKTSLPGLFNVENILGALLCLKHLKVPLDPIKKELEQIYVKGRFENITPQAPFSIIVDYAHSPDALENILKTARGLFPSKIITLFGCGGERDALKRPLMGAIASRLSDITILTTDNPRGENPYQIIEDIKKGIPPTQMSTVMSIINRKKAITKAIHLLKEGDILLIAGKGHEEYQIFKQKTLPFSDHQITLEILKETPYAHTL